MSTTALDIITDAAKLIGAVFKSEALDDDEANDGLRILNDMLDSWSNDDLVTYAYTLENFAMTGATSYTMGSGGDFNTTRPINIVDAVIRYGTIDYPLKVISQEEYQTEVALKSLTTPIPTYLTYDNAYPLATIKMYTVPSAGSTLYLQSNKPLANLSSLTSTVDLPPGWKRALKYNLAIDMAPEYGNDAIQTVSALMPIAMQAKGAIKRATDATQPKHYMDNDIQSRNIFTGWYS